MSVMAMLQGVWAATPSRRWRSGRWALELRGDELADLSFGDRTVLRSIRVVVRDRDWNTAELDVVEVSATDDLLELTLRTHGLGAQLSGTLRVETAEHRLVVRLDLESATDFWANRIGLVVLHPPTLAGEALRVRHADGSAEVLAFPAEISPHQPVRGIAELAWRHDGTDVDVRFGGDVFEMEDQRNWTDASYKTYSRPLELAFPFLVGAGEHVRQCVEVRARVDRAAAPAADPDRIVLVANGAFPTIGVGASTAPDPAPAAVAGRAKPPVAGRAQRDETHSAGAFTLVELDLTTANWRAALARAAASGLPLDVRLVLSDADPAAVLEAARELHGHRLARIAAFAASGPSAHVSDAAAVAALRTALAAAGVDVPVVGGARSHFTELNRGIELLPRGLDGVVFSVTPLFHSRGAEQLIESLAIQRLISTQAVRMVAGTPVHIGPVTLRPRFNNVATTPPPAPPGPDLGAGYGPELLEGSADDPRQVADELAAWTIASAAALAVPGVASLAFHEEWGPRGIRTSDGADLPVAAAVRALASLSGRGLLYGASPDGLVWAVGAASDDGEAVLVANLDRTARSISIATPAGAHTVDLPAGAWVQLGR